MDVVAGRLAVDPGRSRADAEGGGGFSSRKREQRARGGPIERQIVMIGAATVARQAAEGAEVAERIERRITGVEPCLDVAQIRPVVGPRGGVIELGIAGRGKAPLAA